MKVTDQIKSAQVGKDNMDIAKSPLSEDLLGSSPRMWRSTARRKVIKQQSSKTGGTKDFNYCQITHTITAKVDKLVEGFDQ